jgi:hypothetical protein
LKHVEVWNDEEFQRLATSQHRPSRTTDDSDSQSLIGLDNFSGFHLGSVEQGGKLRNPDGDSPHLRPNSAGKVAPASWKTVVRQEPEEDTIGFIKQPVTRPISEEQLVIEVKAIYASLVMVENKCIDVHNARISPEEKLNNEQWQALIALHRTLLNEHHDFFLASQHPSAGPALRRLAAKYAMPNRMWRHGVYTFLEFLRLRLPASLEHMVMFIYLAYAIVALTYETVPAFEDTWIECLGDLGRYRSVTAPGFGDESS